MARIIILKYFQACMNEDPMVNCVWP